MTTMHEIYDQDLNGPKHENEADCKAPQMSKDIWDVIEKAKAGDTCVFTACMNVLLHAYGDRFLKRDVSPEEFIKGVVNTFEAQVEEIEGRMLDMLCPPHKGHMH